MLKHIWIGLFVLSAAATFVGCDDGDDPNPGNDTGDVDDNDTDDNDVDDDIADGSLGLAATCAHSHQCASGLCVVLGQGVNDALCSQRCDTASNCGDPGVWDCTEVDSSANDSVSVCVPQGLCLDNDGDGYGIGPGCLGPDCNDDDPDVYFGAQELCDGKDNDCNGIVDDHTVIDEAPCPTGLEGVCAVGASSCVDGVAVCRTVIEPGSLPEECDNLDNDCDGLIDESPDEDENGVYVTGTGLACSTTGDAQCQNGITMCDPTVGIRCHVSSSFVDDTCDGIDNDCNGLIDDAVPGLNVPCIVGEGQCAAQGITVCGANPDDPPICDAAPNDGAATPEICDNVDNDCNGLIDDPFVNDDGVYYRAEHCGGCGNDCNAAWASSDYADTVIPTCDITTNAGSQNPARCSYTCAGGRIDLDGDAGNGCEFLPNPRAVYVAPENKGGSDDAFCGGYDAPCQSISKAIEMAALYTSAGDERDEIIIAEGIYREGVTLPNGISIKGGYSALNWQRSIEVFRTIIIGSVSGVGNQRVTVLAASITQPTELSGFTIIGEDGLNGANSIALLVRNASNNLVIRDNVLRAGLGGQGASGAPGIDGDAGGGGGTGIRGRHINSSTCGSGDANDGGAGGISDCTNPGGGGTTVVNGGAGASALCPTYGGSNPAPTAGMGSAPGAGGSSAAGRGLYGSACYPHPDMIDESFPSNGALGGIGADGSGGQGAQDGAGALDGTGMWRAASGAAGAHGAHGSGGGGGGASHGTLHCTGIDGDDRIFQNCEVIRLIGSGGGGGGGGGCAGYAATGGGGGGASVALFVHALSVGQLPVIEDNLLERNAGGQGGDGGIAGRGGDGGAGGGGGPEPTSPNALYCPQVGRSGGNGGRGGHGGGGGGGAGGISFDIAVFGTSINASTLEANNTFGLDNAADTGGDGGPGGGSMGNPGLQGVDGLYGRIHNP